MRLALRSPFTALAALALVGACGGPLEETDETGATGGDDAALSSTYRGVKLEYAYTGVRTAGLLFTAKTPSAPTSALAFIPDDGYGTTATTRTGFTTTFSPQDLRPLVEGQPIFLNFAIGSGAAAKSLVAKADLRTTVVRKTGSTTVSPRAWFQAFQVGGQSVVRVRGSLPTVVTSVSAKLEGKTIAGVAKAKEWILDVPTVDFLAAVKSTHTLSLAVTSGRTTYRTGLQLSLVVSRLTLSEGDAYEMWPAATCTDAVRACLASAGPDTSACGDAYTVRRCPAPGSIGPMTADDARGWLSAAMEDLAPDYVPNYARIYGEARGEALTEAASNRVHALGPVLVGRTFATPELALTTARDLARPVYAEALAHPLHFLTPAAPRPGNLENARLVAMEAVLAKLDGMNLQQTEYGRTLDQVVAQSTANWVNGLGDLRTGTGTAEVLTNTTTWSLLGTVLSAHVEVDVSRVTGSATRVLFEID